MKNDTKTLISRPSPPIITHTAPTPQDSPNTTFDTSYKDLTSQDVNNRKLSFTSVDKFTVSTKNACPCLSELTLFTPSI